MMSNENNAAASIPAGPDQGDIEVGAVSFVHVGSAWALTSKAGAVIAYGVGDKISTPLQLDAPSVAPAPESQPADLSFFVIVDEHGCAEFVTDTRQQAQEHINDACTAGVDGAGKWKALPVITPASGGVDWEGIAYDLEKLSDRVESQTVQRAMLDGAHGLRLMAASSAPVPAASEGWISVGERLPDDRQAVAFIADTKGWETFAYLHGRPLGGTYDAKNNWFNVPGLSVAASHWMPLPAAPATSDKAEGV